MSTLTLRNAKGSPLTNQEADDNLSAILVAIGGTNTSPYTIPTPSGTGSPVLTSNPTIDSPRITTVALIGPSTAANLTRFPNALTAISNTVAGIQQNESHNIGLVAEGTAHATNPAIYGIGVYGKGYTNSATRSGGVVGEGHVSATGDTGSAIGIRGYANDTHAGGMNIGLYADANNGATNYALYMNSGNITNITSQTWTLGGNLSFSGAYTITIPTLSLSNALTVGNGGTGTTSLTLNNVLLGNGTSAVQTIAPGTSGNVLTSNGTTWVSGAAPISLPTQTGNNGKYLTTDGSTASWATVSAGLIATGIKTANYTAVANDLVRCNTTSGAFSITMPASPTDGTIIGVVDTNGTFATNNLTVLPNTSQNVEGDSTSLILDISATYIVFTYISASSKWKAQITPTAQMATTVSSAKTIANKTGAYTVISSDSNAIINCTSGTFTVSLTAAASLGSGFNCSIWNTSNTSTDAITIDPAGAETIDGIATLLLRVGEGLDIVCDGTNWQISNKKPMRGYAENLASNIIRPIASGNYSIAIGNASSATGTSSLALGHSYATASSNYSTALGMNSGGNSSQSVTGAGAMSLGGSYSSGIDSFSAAIANNTSSYGSQGSNSISIGSMAKATGTTSLAIGSLCTASQTRSLAIGTGTTSSGINSVAIGYNLISSGIGSVALGSCSGAAQSGKYAFSGMFISAIGDSQYGKLVIFTSTTSSITKILNSDGAPTANTANQLVVATGQAMAFFGTLIAKQTASANISAYMIKGAIVNNGGTVTLSTISVETLIDTIGLTTQPTYTVDSTNKALTITSGAKLGTSIYWVCDLSTTEVTYA